MSGETKSKELKENVKMCDFIFSTLGMQILLINNQLNNSAL